MAVVVMVAGSVSVSVTVPVAMSVVPARLGGPGKPDHQTGDGTHQHQLSHAEVSWLARSPTATEGRIGAEMWRGCPELDIIQTIVSIERLKQEKRRMSGTANVRPGAGRGEDSRQRIIEAALDVFGRHGFEGASTRMLAQAAGVNLAAIAYYFGGKEGLYRAVAEHVVAAISERQAEAAARAKAALEDPSLGREAALEQLLDLVDSLAVMLVAAGPADRWAAFVIREQMQPAAAFDIIFHGFQARMHGLVAGLVARVLGRDPRDPEVLVTASTLIGQVLVFRAARTTMLKLLDWTEFTPERVAMIRTLVRRNVTRILTPGDPR
jgi:AcrR family transcriptional regulator